MRRRARGGADEASTRVIGRPSRQRASSSLDAAIVVVQWTAGERARKCCQGKSCMRARDSRRRCSESTESERGRAAVGRRAERRRPILRSRARMARAASSRWRGWGISPTMGCVIATRFGHRAKPVV